MSQITAFSSSPTPPVSSSLVLLTSATFDTKSLTAQELFTPTSDFVLSSIVILATDVQGFVASFDTLTIGTNSPSYDDLDITISGFGLDSSGNYIGALPSYSSSTPLVLSGTPIYGLVTGLASDATVFDVTIYAVGFYV